MPPLGKDASPGQGPPRDADRGGARAGRRGEKAAPPSPGFLALVAECLCGKKPPRGDPDRQKDDGEKPLSSTMNSPAASAER